MTEQEKAEAVVAGLRGDDWCPHCQQYVGDVRSYWNDGCWRCFRRAEREADKIEAKRQRDTWKTTRYGHN